MKKTTLSMLALALLLCGVAVASAQTETTIAPVATTARGINTQMGVRDYLLGPGDVLELKVFNETQFDGTLEISSDGTVIVPFVETPITAVCRRIEDVRVDVIAALGKMLKRPQVNLQIRERRSRVPASVYGAVQTPTRFEMYRRVRLLELISYSGGVTERANGTIRVFHTPQSFVCDAEEKSFGIPSVDSDSDSTATGATTTDTSFDPTQVRFDEYRIEDLKRGIEAANPYIRPGDIVKVEEAEPVYITGAVVQPQGVFLREGLTLSRALAQVGGVRKEAKTDKIRIIRSKPNSNEQPELIAVNYKKIRDQKEPDILLKPYDIIEVGEANPFSPGRIGETLLGFATAGAGSFIGQAPVRVLY
ncbi:MAG: SLBB domain-containing protein [Pyrinomonadaceae bacterium MAG19_C2-C3]|nr:SLBB domain-containing protein [Pyrinomonadaceae bacterium MAG19_C2-C3]